MKKMLLLVFGLLLITIGYADTTSVAGKEITHTYSIGGGISIVDYLILYLFGGMGMLVTIFFEYTQRDKTSERTPVPFSRNFWWRDNKWRLGMVLLVFFIVIRFSDEVLGIQINEYWMIGIGASIDIIIAQLMKKLRFGKGVVSVE